MTLPEFTALQERKRANEEWADYRTGMVASVIANVNRAKGVRPYTPADFMPSLKRYAKPQTWEQQLATVMMITEVQKIKAEKAKAGASS